MLRRGSGQGAECADVWRGGRSGRCSWSRRMSGGHVRGRDGDADVLTQVCCVPESRQGQVLVKVSPPSISVHFSAAQILPQCGGSPGCLPSQC